MKTLTVVLLFLINSLLYAQTPDVWHGKVLHEQSLIKSNINRLEQRINRLTSVVTFKSLSSSSNTCDSLCTKVIKIGPWDMDFVQDIVVNHGLGTGFKRIRVVNAIVVHDAVNVHYSISGFSDLDINAGIKHIDQNGVALEKGFGWIL